MASDRSDHKASITSSFLGQGWYAECMCGWASTQTVASPEEASALAARHIAEMTGKQAS